MNKYYKINSAENFLPLQRPISHVILDIGFKLYMRTESRDEMNKKKTNEPKMNPMLLHFWILNTSFQT